jgi:hypothetical protein
MISAPTLISVAQSAMVTFPIGSIITTKMLVLLTEVEGENSLVRRESPNGSREYCRLGPIGPGPESWMMPKDS